MHKRKTIKIFGAGVGGLTAAHMLSPFFNIQVYELKDKAGGLARTIGPLCDTKEISWRVYFHFYKNLFQILKEIKRDDDTTVFDHLVPYENVNIPDATPYSWLQLLKVAKLITASDSRLNDYDRVTWYNYMNQQWKTDTHRDAIPQWLGMDRYRGSTLSVIKIGIEQSVLARKNNLIGYVLDGPTSDIWFDPWVKQLENQGVQFYFNTEIINVNMNNNKVKSVCTRDSCLTADYYIFGLPVETMAKLFPSNQLNKLAQKGYQVQLAFQMHLAKRLSFGMQDGYPVVSILLSNTPWGIIIEAKDISWQNNIIQQMCPLAQWSVTVCQADTPGIVTGKTLYNCTQQEAYLEILTQILADVDFMNYLKKYNFKFVPEDIKVVRWGTMSDTYHLDGPGHFYTSEPKFTNNAETKELRPPVYLFPNAFLTTGYAQETIDIFSMEAAAISGKLASKLILAKEQGHILAKEEIQALLPSRPKPELEFFRSVDEFLFQLGLPDILTVIGALGGIYL